MSGLAAPDPSWPTQADAEATRWRDAVKGLVTIHHIGSTALPGLPCKPIFDLLPVFADATSADAAQPVIEALGYEWLGAHGLKGRRYCRRCDPRTGARMVHAHAYVQKHPNIRRHLAFRDALRDNGPLSVASTAIKAACAARHPELGAEYGACKSNWIAKVEARAMETYK